ncbi:MAG: Kae1-associated kinase Bud32 [Methanolobus sp.]|nr:Kae1-associated kinase Bud32 [Methanolobus sp.]
MASKRHCRQEMNMYLISGAEASVKMEDGVLIKERVPKSYRLKDLDERIRRERTKAEARLLSEARRAGVPTPIIYDIYNSTIKMQYLNGTAVKHVIDENLSEQIGSLVAELHMAGIIHGDLTTSNLIFFNDRIYMIDFGLAFNDSSIEARGVDVHVLFQTFESTHRDHGILIDAFCRGYRKDFRQADEVLERVKEIEKRGRYA